MNNTVAELRPLDLQRPIESTGGRFTIEELRDMHPEYEAAVAREAKNLNLPVGAIRRLDLIFGHSPYCIFDREFLPGALFTPLPTR